MKHSLSTFFTVVLTIGSVFVTLVGNTVAQPVPGMIAYWRFDDNTGTTAVDSVGFFDGVIHGATWTTGQVGSALRFDGVDDYISIGDIGLDTSAFSIALWLKTENWEAEAGRAGALIADNYCFWCSPSTGWLFWIYTETFWFPVNHNDSVTGAAYPEYKDMWTFVVFTKDSEGHTALYFNGSEAASYVEHTPWVTPYFPAGEHIEIGRRADEGWYFRGILDEVAIYTRAVTAAEVQQHYQLGMAGQGYDVSEPTPPPTPVVTPTPSGEPTPGGTPIPEPGTLTGFILAGLLGFVGLAWKRRHAQRP